jgi:ATP-dependent RNA helicase DDX54/DBP10
MPRRQTSPALSENEVDIADSLFAGIADEEQPAKRRGQGNVVKDDIDDILNAGGGSGEEEDEAFIALQQAASFRKASNLKGRTVKKGGGFQAMGRNRHL